MSASMRPEYSRYSCAYIINKKKKTDCKVDYSCIYFLSNTVDTWFLIDMVDMIMTTKFPKAVVNKLIADIKDLMFIGAYIE